jgi:hypothetical protein
VVTATAGKAGEGGCVRIRVPIKLESEGNARGHWAGKADRVKSVRQAVTAAFIDAGHAVRREQKVGPKKAWYVVRLVSPPALPLKVTITRVAPRALDSVDNIASACKAPRDQVAELLGIDDRDKRVTWAVDQRRGGVGEHACEIAIEPRVDAGVEVDRG